MILVATPNHRSVEERHTSHERRSPLPFDLPSVARKKLSVGFDGGQLSPDAGVLLLRGWRGGGEEAWSGRSACFVHPGMAQARAHRAPAYGDAYGDRPLRCRLR